MDADLVFLLMKHDFRISRNTRAQWYFHHLNQKFIWSPSKHDEPEHEDLEVTGIVSVPGKSSAGFPDVDPPDTYTVTPSTVLTFLSGRHRLVFVLDLSPSLAVVDNYQGEVLFGKIFEALQQCLEGLLEPFIIPGSGGRRYSPQIYVTVIAHTPFFMSNAQEVLLQGAVLTTDNLPDILYSIQCKLKTFEDQVSKTSSIALEQLETHKEFSESLTGRLFEDTSRRDSTSELFSKAAMVSPDTGLVNMLRKGILAMQLLPENTSASLIVITDGVTGVPDTLVLNSLLSQLRSLTVACSFIQVRSGYHPECSFGHVPYSELMQFLATATFGAYLPIFPSLDIDCTYCLNIYQKAFMCWTFQRALYGFKFDPTLHREWEESSWKIRNPSFSANAECPLLQKTLISKTLSSNLSNLLYVRLREGYTISDVRIDKADGDVQVKLVLPWHDHVNMIYRVTATWPANEDESIVTKFDLSVEAPYDFLYDISLHNPVFKSPYRRSLVNSFFQSVNALSDADRLLIHLHSFGHDPAFYIIPEGVKKGMPLFCMSNSSMTPTVSSKDYQEKYSAFCNFWSRVCRLDINIWQKWLHTHRLSLVLEHDTPLPRYLHATSTAQGRYCGITYRQAAAALHEMLKTWSSFTLIEKHSYINFIYEEDSSRPSYFYIIRATLKPPCVTLRIAFLGGIRGLSRNMIVGSIRTKLMGLRITQRRESSLELIRSSFGSPRKSPVYAPPLETHACILFQKPIEKIMIRYTSVPENLSCFIMSEDESISGPLTSSRAINRAASTVYNMLSRYFHRRRWIWSLRKHFPGYPLQLNDVGLIIQTLVRRRLQEGFRFGCTATGIVNMVMEVDMESSNSGSDFFDDEEQEDEKCCSEDTIDVDDDDDDDDCTDTDGNDDYDGIDGDKAIGHGKRLRGESVRGHLFCDRPKCLLQYVVFPPVPATIPVMGHSESFDSSEDLSEAESCTEADSDLLLVTELWVEPQDGDICCSKKVPGWCRGAVYGDLAAKLFALDQSIIEGLTTFEHLRSYEKSNKDSSSPDKSTKSVRKARFTDKTSFENEVQFTSSCFNFTSLLGNCQQATLLFSCLSSPDCRDIADINNQSFYSRFLKEMSRTHGPIMDVPEEQLEQLWSHALSRYFISVRSFDPSEILWRRFFSSISGPSPSSSLETCDDYSAIPKLVAFSKALYEDRLSVIVMPASFQDVVMLNRIHEKEHPGTGEPLAEKGYSPMRTGDTPSLEDAKGARATVTSSYLSDSQTRWSLEPFVFPVFVYNIFLPKVVHRCVNKSGSTPRRQSIDLVDDYTIKLESVLSSLHRQISMASMEATPRSSRFPSIARLDDIVNEVGTDDERGAALLMDDFDLGAVCQDIEHAYSMAYVSAIYEAILTDVPISHRDIIAAIDGKCEETLLEIDTTEFMSHVCPHKTAPPQIRSEPSWEEPDDADSLLLVRSNTLDTFTSASSRVSVSVRTGTKFACDDPRNGCKSALHIQLKSHFLAILQQRFQPVPGAPGYFCLIGRTGPNIEDQDGSDDERMLRADSCASFQGIDAGSDGDDDDDDDDGDVDDSFVAFMDSAITGFQYFCSPGDGLPLYGSSAPHRFPLHRSAKDAASSGDGMMTSLSGSDISSIEPDHNDDEDNEIDVGSISSAEEAGADIADSGPGQKSSDGEKPLFLQMTCSLRYENELHSCTVETLPTCLVDLIYNAGFSEPDFTPKDIKVTLDILALSLPTDLRAAYSGDQTYARMYRRESSANLDATSGDVNEKDNEAKLPNKSWNSLGSILDRLDDGNQLEINNRLSQIHPEHRQVLESMVKEIKLLLADEVTFALRLLPQEEETLHQVTQHIIRSTTSTRLPTASSYVEFPIVFVMNEFQGLENLEKEIDSLRLFGIMMQRCGSYFYAVPDPYQAVSFASNQLKPVAKLSTCEEVHLEPDELLVPASQRALPYSGAAEVQNANMNRLFRDVSSVSSVRRCRSLPDLACPPPKNFQDRESDCCLRRTRSLEDEMGDDPKMTDSNQAFEVTAANIAAIRRKNSARRQHSKRNPSGTSIGSYEGDNKQGLLDKFLASETTSISFAEESMHDEGTTEAGYAAESEDMDFDMDGNETIRSDMRSVLVPDFWLIIEICSDHTTSDYPKMRICYQRRDQSVGRRGMFESICQEMRTIIKKINQKMLLSSLCETKKAHNLLLAASPEEVWPSLKPGDDQDELEEEEERLAAASKFKPGSFACPSVWYTVFKVHPRLRAGARSKGTVEAVEAMKTGVLNKMAVSNRDHTYVYRHTSGNVFYLRLHSNPTEIPQLIRQANDEIAGSLKEKELRDLKEMVDSCIQEKAEAQKSCLNVILLTYHGITSVDMDFRTSLTKLLHAELDKAVLEAMCISLSRNPFTKLTYDDVEFIQPPHLEPLLLNYVIPPGAVQHLYAFGHYLRQHLMEFLHVPNYVKDVKEFRIGHKPDGQHEFIGESGVYIYAGRLQGGRAMKHSPSGGESIACITFRLIDENGGTLKILCHDRFESDASNPLETSEPDYRRWIETSVRSGELNSVPESAAMEAPEPVNYVQFSTWIRGKKDIQQRLCDNLESAVRYSLCDVFTEYALMTAPLHMANPDATDTHSGPLSEPGSPTGIGSTDSDELRRRHVSAVHPVPLKDHGSIFNFDSVKSSIRRANIHSTSSAASLVRRKTSVPASSRSPYYANNPAYGRTPTSTPELILSHALVNGRAWLDETFKLGCSTVRIHKCNLATSFSVHNLLVELYSILRKECHPTTDVFCFAGDTAPPILDADDDSPTDDDGQSPKTIYRKHEPAFNTAQVSGDTSSGTWISRKKRFIILARSMELYNVVMNVHSFESPTLLWEAVQRCSVKGPEPLQRFPAVMVPSQMSDTSPAYGFVPRQRLLLVDFDNYTVTAYLYNWSKTWGESFERYLAKLVKWQNARSHLLNRICLQKMGLFYVGRPSKQAVEENKFLGLCWAHPELFIKSNPPPNRLATTDVSRIPEALAATFRPWGEEQKVIWSKCSTSVPERLGMDSDPLLQQGLQLTEIKRRLRSFLERNVNLASLHNAWLHQESDTQVSVKDVTIRRLSECCHLEQILCSPLLFHPRWREMIASVRSPHWNTVTTAGTSPPDQPHLQRRCRHNSGLVLPIVNSSPILRPHAGEEMWHIQLMNNLLIEYGDHILPLGFSLINIVDPVDQDNSMAKWYHKTFPEGILLVHLHFADPYFVLRLYSLDIGTISCQGMTSQEMYRFRTAVESFIFDKHVHSFCHDYHINTLYKYVKEKKPVFRPNYHMTAFLDFFIRYYNRRPPFSRTNVAVGSLTVSGLSTTADKLFDYLLRYAKQYGYEHARMRTYVRPSDEEEASDYVLVRSAVIPAKTAQASDSEGDCDSMDHEIVQILFKADTLMPQPMSQQYPCSHVDSGSTAPSHPTSGSSNTSPQATSTASPGVPRSHHHQHHHDTLSNTLTLKFYLLISNRSGDRYRVDSTIPVEVEEGLYQKLNEGTVSSISHTTLSSDTPSTSATTSPSKVAPPTSFHQTTSTSAQPTPLIAASGIAFDIEQDSHTFRSRTRSSIARLSTPSSSSRSAMSRFRVDKVQETPEVIQRRSSSPTLPRKRHRRRASMATFERLDVLAASIQAANERSSSPGTLQISIHRQDSRQLRRSACRPDEGSLFPDSVTVLAHTSKTEMQMQALVRDQVQATKAAIKRVLGEAMAHCRRDQLWSMVCATSADGGKKSVYSMSISFTEFEELLSCVHFEALEDMNPLLAPIIQLNSKYWDLLVRILSQHYGSTYFRHATNSEGQAEHMVVLNSNNMSEMFLLVSKISGEISMKAVFKRDKGSEADDTFRQLPTIEDFVNTLAYFHWCTLFHKSRDGKL